MEQLSPIEIARQALLQLAMRKIPPTPDHFKKVYDEIAGVKSVDASVEIAKTFKKVLQEAGLGQPKYVGISQQINEAIEKSDWQKLEDNLRKMVVPAEKSSKELSWAVVIRNLLKQLEVSHKGVTLTRKKEGLSKVLARFEQDEAELANKIVALINSWGLGVANEAAGIDDVYIESNLIAGQQTSYPISAPAEPQAFMASQLREIVIKTFELVIVPQLELNREAQLEANNLQQKLLVARSDGELSEIARGLKSLWITLEIQRDNQLKINSTLMQLLRLTVESMGELVVEDKWLHAQTEIISDIIAKPINLNTLYDAESSLKDFIYKQHNIRPALIEARDTLKKMAETFVHRLADVSESTVDYQGKIEEYQDQISKTDDILELNTLLSRMLEDTKVMGISVQRTRDMLQETQQRAKDAEATINKLSAELDHINAMAQQDYLTGALNRRGMDEALDREFKRADRFQATLSIGMMDIDHFKKLNDTLGHATGDIALKHLASIVKASLRSTDEVARFGGEEFIIIMPATNKQEASNIITRIQRELTKNYFLHNNDKVLITFSAGVAERKRSEAPQQVIERADGALYVAKTSGRNRVVTAD